MTNTKLTKRDRYNSIITLLAVAEADPAVIADLTDFCKGEIELLDKKAAKAKETAAAKKTEVDPLTVAVQAALGTLAEDAYATIADVTAMVAVDDADVTPAKVSYRLSQLVKAEVAVSKDVKVPATDGGKARTVKGYRLA